MMINPSIMKKVMKQLRMEEITANRVIIETPDSNIVINNPQVQRMKINGQDSFQITGEAVEEKEDVIEVSEDDIELIMEKTGKDRESVINALSETEGDMAGAIMKLSEQ